jgi:hypothetical protein
LTSAPPKRHLDTRIEATAMQISPIIAGKGSAVHAIRSHRTLLEVVDAERVPEQNILVRPIQCTDSLGSDTIGLLSMMLRRCGSAHRACSIERLLGLEHLFG